MRPGEPDSSPIWPLPITPLTTTEVHRMATFDDPTELRYMDLFAALDEAKRKLPQFSDNPQGRLKVSQTISPLTDELQRRYPVPDYRPSQ